MKNPFRIRNVFSCARGVAAIEFALSLPLLMGLMMGGFELSRYVILHQKLEKVAYTVADVVSQSDSITNAQLGQAVLAASTILDREDFTQNGVVYISSVYKNGTNEPTVRWQYHGGGGLSRTSHIGALNNNAVLPNGLTLNDKDNIIIAEVFYTYPPLLGGGIFSDTVDIYKVTVFKPRLGALTTPPA